jgi:hypothetical protein
LRCLDPVHVRHSHVYENDIWSKVLYLLDGFLSVACLATYFDSRAKRTSDPLSYNFVIVNQ